MREEPIALRAYEELAEAYAARVDTKPHNAYYDRPAMLSLLPDLAGKRVLDAGCGPGAYAERLVALGAEVVAVDVSPKMVALARERLGDTVEVHEADLREPLSFLADGSVDVVVAPLVLDYVRDLAPVFAEFHRVLRAGGLLVFSDGHPLFDFLFFGTEDYFATEEVGCVWKGFGVPVYVPGYRRPLSAMLNPLIDAGFAIDRILEPRPTEEFRRAEPEDYERLMRKPGFWCVRARRG